MLVCMYVCDIFGILLQKGQREFEHKCGEYEELIQETKQQLEVNMNVNTCTCTCTYMYLYMYLIWFTCTL